MEIREATESTPKTIIFTREQKIIQLPGESSAQLHERLRMVAFASFRLVQEPTKIITPSWYTFDGSQVLEDIPDAVVVCTSTCKHEPPFQIFVGRRTRQDWMVEKPAKQNILGENPIYIYQLEALGRELTGEEKNEIYDKM